VFRTELIAETRRSFAKTRTLPKGASAGGVSGTLKCGRYEGLSYEGPASQTRGRAKSSSRNGRPRKAHRTRSWKPAAALTDWTPRAGTGYPRSLAQLDGRAGPARHGCPVGPRQRRARQCCRLRRPRCPRGRQNFRPTRAIKIYCGLSNHRATPESGGRDPPHCLGAVHSPLRAAQVVPDSDPLQPQRYEGM